MTSHIVEGFESVRNRFNHEGYQDADIEALATQLSGILSEVFNEER